MWDLRAVRSPRPVQLPPHLTDGKTEAEGGEQQMCKRCKAQALEPGSRIHLAPGSATYYKLQIFGGKKKSCSLSASVSHLQIV